MFLTHSVTCNDGPTSTSDVDLLYPSLIPGTLLYSSHSQGENVPVAVDDPQVFQTKTSWSLQEMLEQLAPWVSCSLARPILVEWPGKFPHRHATEMFMRTLHNRLREYGLRRRSANRDDAEIYQAIQQDV